MKTAYVMCLSACNMSSDHPAVFAFPHDALPVMPAAATWIGVFFWHLETQCETMAEDCDLILFILSQKSVLKVTEQNSLILTESPCDYYYMIYM